MQPANEILTPNADTPTAEPAGAHVEARRLLALGFKLCELHPMSKRPVGDDWQKNPVRAIREGAGGYGLMLAPNGLCSIDPDNLGPAREGLKRCGFDLGELMRAGVRTSSTRPGSGGRSTFKAGPGLRRVTFSSKQHGTILELRAAGSNLQDCLPGTVYQGKDGSVYRQDYANGRTFDEAPELPAALATWWRRLSTDLEFKRQQQALLCGVGAQLSVSGEGDALAFSSTLRRGFNAEHDVSAILERHGYTTADGERWAPPTATGAPCVREIPGKEGLWHSDHASDPLEGTFDAWTAFVVLDHGGDLSAAEQAQTTAVHAAIAQDFEVLEVAAGIAPAPKANALRFRVQTLGEFRQRPPLNWLVRGVLPKAELGVVFGESGSGKTFFTLDLVAAVARGVEWRGRRVTQGRVVYICAEGAGGFRDRLAAYCDHHGVALDIGVIPDAPNLLERADALDLAASIKAFGTVDVIVVDTLAQVTAGGNENSGQDMGRALAHCKALARATGALVLLVHHAGKDASKGARGWSGLRAAADVEIEVTRVGDARHATITKLKDGTDGADFGFTLESVAVGEDEDGDEISSCIVAHNEASKPALRQAAPKGAKQQLVLRVARDMLDLADDVTTSELIDNVVQQIPFDKAPGKRDKRREHIMRALESLTAGGQMSTAGGFVSLQ